MPQTSQHVDSLNEIIELFNADKLTRIDFDLIRRQLTDISGILARKADSEQQFQLLRDDYGRRISGMIKAMAAVDRKTGSLGSALNLIDQLGEMDAAVLMDTYRHTAARFRDCFPASALSGLVTGKNSRSATGYRTG